jgi:hypothetical protein
MKPVVEFIEAQLAARAEVVGTTWSDARQGAFASRFLAQADLTWSRPLFIPEDPLAIVLFSPTYLDDEEIKLWDAGIAFGLELSNAECERLMEGTLGGAVQAFLERGAT